MRPALAPARRARRAAGVVGVGLRAALVATLALAVGAATQDAAADRGSHGAFFAIEPAVYRRHATCTAAPPPAAPALAQRRSPRARLLVRVTGRGAYCHARWTADRAAPGSTAITLTADADADAPSTCGTCTIDLLITRLGRGDYTVTLDGSTLRAHAP